MKLHAILKEVTANRDREMVTGVAEILRQVKDETNREQIATNMMRQFDQEGVEYDQLEFLKMSNVYHTHPINTVQHNAHHKVTADHTDVRRIAAERKRLKEIGEATADPYPLSQPLGTERLDRYEFATDAGNLYEILIDKDTNGTETYYEVAFAVMEKGPVMFPGHRPGMSRNFNKEVNDPKNLFRVMATVIAAIKISIRNDERGGLRVTRVIMNPTKKDSSDTRRSQLYKKYIEKHMPAGSRVYTEPDGSRIQIELPRA